MKTDKNTPNQKENTQNYPKPNKNTFAGRINAHKQIQKTSLGASDNSFFHTIQYLYGKE